MEFSDKNQETENKKRFLSFFLGDNEFAIDILRVKEILQYDAITSVPNTPKSVRGVINLRGSVVPVIDLSKKFTLPDREVTKRTCIILVEVTLNHETSVMGFLVDSVNQVRSFALRDIEEPPSFGTHVNIHYLQGMGKVGKQLIMILDVDRILSSDELQEANSAQQKMMSAAK